MTFGAVGLFRALHACLDVFIAALDAPQVLLSFPTRRSSDLRGTPTSSFSTSARLTSPATPTAFIPRDRKSTRLNSSHLVISYAVFCLKKQIIVLAAMGDSAVGRLRCQHAGIDGGMAALDVVH